MCFADNIQDAAGRIHALGAYKVEWRIYAGVLDTVEHYQVLNGNPGISAQQWYADFRFTTLEEVARGMAQQALGTGVGGMMAAQFVITWQPDTSPQVIGGKRLA